VNSLLACHRHFRPFPVFWGWGRVGHYPPRTFFTEEELLPLRPQVLNHFLVSVFCLALAACHKKTSVSEDIGRVLNSRASQVDMRSVANFVWDDMFIFGPYTPKDQICQTLKHSVSQCSYEGIRDVDESEHLIVFLHSASVTRVESLPRTVGDFDDNCLNKDLKRDAVVLSVQRRPRVYLVCR
jgi:hypothetical protein